MINFIQSSYHQVAEVIEKHPVFSGITGGAQAFLFSMINTSDLIAGMELVGVFFKTLGIVAGSSIAIASMIKYFFRKKKDQ